MKRKILAVGVLSLCCLGLAAGESQAFFGMFNPWNPYSYCNRHNRYVTQITCRPYNAFTPIAWGNLVCDGCVPNPCGVASGCLPLTMGPPPWACPGNCGPSGCGMPYMGGGCGSGGCCASDMGPMMSSAPMMSSPPSYPMPMPQDNRGPGGFQGPMPMPVGPNTTMMYPPNAGVAQANYQPAYYPMPYPNYYMPNYANPYAGWQQPMPSYWYGR
jgi:hypothetical protein